MISHTENTTPPHETRRFLDMFGERHCFQTFDDRGRNPKLARTLHGSLDELRPTLTHLNRAGAGIFVAVNEIAEGKRRLSENVIRCRALFADHDDPARSPEVKTAVERFLPPSITVASSPGKLHFYWLTDDCPPNHHFSDAQHALAAVLGTDPSVCDLPRVMRVPGFYHMKREPFRVRLLEASTTIYHFADLVPMLHLGTAGGATSSHTNTTTVVSALTTGKPTTEYHGAPSQLNAAACRGLVNVDEIDAASRHYPSGAIFWAYEWWRDNWLFPVASAIALAPEHAARLRTIFDRENRRTADPAKASEAYFAHALALLDRVVADNA